MPDAPRKNTPAQPTPGAPLNIANSEDIALFAESFAERVQRDEAKHWFRANLRNWLLREPRFARPVCSEELVALAGLSCSEDLPHWMRKAFAENRPLHWFDPARAAPELIGAMHGLVDWFESLPDDDPRWRQPDRMAVDDAIAASQAWRLALARRVANEWPEHWPGIETIMPCAHAVTAVRLSSSAALRREGRMMGHCVAAYARKVESGRCAIYSLRDDLNRPHVTMEVINNAVVQIRGRCNSMPNHKWIRHIATFIRAMDWRASAWAGLLVFEGRVYADADDVLADLSELAPMQNAAFDYRRLVPIIRLLQRAEHRTGVLSEKRQKALLDALGAASRTSGGYRLTRAPHAALDIPGDEPIAELNVEIAGAAFKLAEMGFFPDVTADVAALCTDIARRVLALVEEHPEALYRLNIGTGVANRAAVARFFASAGLGADYQRLRRETLAHKRAHVGRALIALRRRLADRRSLASISDAERTRALNAIRVQAPYFCEHTLDDPGVA